MSPFLLRKLPWFVQKAANDIEGNWTITGLRGIYLFEDYFAGFLPNCVVNNNGWNTGWGDAWAREETIFWQYLRLRIRDMYLDSQ